MLNTASVLHAGLVLSQQFNETRSPPRKQRHQLLFLYALFVHEYSEFKAIFNIAVSHHTAQQLPTSLLHTTQILRQVRNETPFQAVEMR